MSTNTCSLGPCCSFLVSPFPLITPALKQDSCATDRDLLNKRVWLVAAAALALFISSFLAPVVQLPLLLAAVGCLCVLPLDKWMTERAADKQAVNEYLTKKTPSLAAWRHIRTHLSAAKRLISKKKGINKRAENKRKLLDCLYDFEILKCFVKGHCHFTLNQLILLSLTTESKFLKLLLEEKVIDVNKLSKKDQATLLFCLIFAISSPQKIKLLKQHGFDLNMRHPTKKNKTALMCLAESCPKEVNVFPSMYSIRIPFTVASIQALLDQGANPNLTTRVKSSWGFYKDLTAYDLCQNERVKKLLKPTKKRVS